MAGFESAIEEQIPLSQLFVGSIKVIQKRDKTDL
jgi:hypothetical protein